ncbi:MAG: hypothetical protein ACERKD_15495 [Prolixibacteraceae bacterium]
MIQSLIIGNEVDIALYSGIIAQSSYFGQLNSLQLVNNRLIENNLPEQRFDALFLVSQLEEPYPIFEQSIKSKSNIYFVDQPFLSDKDLVVLDQLNVESGNLLFTEVLELEHPLVQEFISTRGNYLMFRYNKSIASKKHIRKNLLSALCFLSILSPMQVKKINVNSMETSERGHPTLKIRLKMYDSSIAYIFLDFETTEEHNIMIESQKGTFQFNLSQNFLENIHGVHFKSSPISNDELLLKTIESFGLHIIMNTPSKFSFHHYCLSINTLDKILNILQNSF